MLVEGLVTSRKHIRVVGAMVEGETGHYLITQRAKDASLPLLWEFPGGRVQPNETDVAALVRELKERLRIDVDVLEQASTLHHAYPHYDLDFSVFYCRLRGGDVEVSHHRVNDHKWVTLAEMSKYPFPDADAKTLEKLLDLDR